MNKPNLSFDSLPIDWDPWCVVWKAVDLGDGCIAPGNETLWEGYLSNLDRNLLYHPDAAGWSAVKIKPGHREPLNNGYYLPYRSKG